MGSAADRLRRRRKQPWATYALIGCAVAAGGVGLFIVGRVVVLPVVEGVVERAQNVGDPNRRAVIGWLEENADDPRGLYIVTWEKFGPAEGAYVYRGRPQVILTAEDDSGWFPIRTESETVQAFHVKYRVKGFFDSTVLIDAVFLIDGGRVVQELRREQFRTMGEMAAVQDQQRETARRAMEGFMGLAPVEQPAEQPEQFPEQPPEQP